MVTALPLPAQVTIRAAVVDQARRLVDAAPVTPAYRGALATALGLPGNVLSAAPDMRWARLVWTCCTAAGGEGEQAVGVAAAVEVFMVALDLLDDLEDGEETPMQAELGAARALNAATGLLFIAQQGLLDAGGVALARLLLDAGQRACSGQHADLTPAAGRPVALDAALAVAAGKSATLAAAICRLGAACASAEAPAQELFARFGSLLGMIAQLANDLKALRPDASGKTDIALGRPTLPLAHAALLASHTETTETEADADIRAAVWTRGPAHLVWAVAATYHGQALDLIPHLTAHPAHGAALAALLPHL